MRMSRSPQNGGFHKCTGGGPLRAAAPAAPAMASRPRVLVCPSFAMVCLELAGGDRPVSSRDRDSRELIHYRLKCLGRGWKRGTAQALTMHLGGWEMGRSWQTCVEAGSHPLKNSVFSRQLTGFGGHGPPHAATLGPNVARFLVKRDARTSSGC